MFFQECEHLADEYPDLKEIIDKVDEIFYSAGPFSVFRSEEIASCLSERKSQVLSVFDILSEKELLYGERYLECPQCENLIVPEDYKKAIDDQNSFECSQCLSDLTNESLEEVEVYRLNPNRIEVFEDSDFEVIERNALSNEAKSTSLPRTNEKEEIREEYRFILKGDIKGYSRFMEDPVLNEVIPNEFKKIVDLHAKGTLWYDI